MPKIYRTMLDDGGKPKVGNHGKMLGVRVVPHPHPDIPVDAQSNVHPGTGGMSVAPNWRKLPWHWIPKRLHPLGRGHDDLVCWRLGDGPFENGDLNHDLVIRLDPNEPTKHGFVEPAKTMTIAEYRAALVTTRDDWNQDEG